MKYYLLCLLVSLSLVGIANAKPFMDVDAKFGNCSVHHKYDEKSAKRGILQSLSLSCRSGDANVSLVCSKHFDQVYLTIENKYFVHRDEGVTVLYRFDAGDYHREKWLAGGPVLIGSDHITSKNTYENFLSGLETADRLFFESYDHEGNIQLEGAKVAVFAFRQLCKDKYPKN